MPLFDSVEDKFRPIVSDDEDDTFRTAVKRLRDASEIADASNMHHLAATARRRIERRYERGMELFRVG